jgi:hypothetical protein
MSEAEQARQMPPATFEFLVASLRMQAEIALMSGPKEEDEPDFSGARHVIDLLGVLEQKTKGNLTFEEQRLLENSLTELRFRYVQAWEDSHKKSAAAEPEAEKS